MLRFASKKEEILSVRQTHPLRVHVFLNVFPDQTLEVSRGEHVDDDDGFGEEHDGEGNAVERSKSDHLAGRAAYTTSFCFPNESMGYKTCGI